MCIRDGYGKRFKAVDHDKSSFVCGSMEMFSSSGDDEDKGTNGKDAGKGWGGLLEEVEG